MNLPADGDHVAVPVTHLPGHSSPLRRFGDKVEAFCARPMSVGGSLAPSPLATAVHMVVLELAVAGGVALGGDLTPRWRVFMFAVVGLVILLRVPWHQYLGCPGKAAEALGSVIGLLIIPVFALMGIDAALAQLGFGTVSPGFGLIFALVLLAGLARVSLEPIWTGFELKHRWRASVPAAFGMTVLPLAVIFVLGAINGDGTKLGHRPVVSRLDVIVLHAGGKPVVAVASPEPQTDAQRQRRQEQQEAGWRVTTWTGRVDGDAIIWGGGRQPVLNGQADTDRVLLLLPPAQDNNHPEHWMAVADRAEPKATPTYALLDDASPAQLDAWRRPLSGTTGRAGDALPIADVGGPTASASELGIRAATQEPGAAPDLALALAHRPILQFDGGEPVTHPLDIDQMFATNYVSMCEAGQKLRSQCRQITSGSDLQTGFDHLAFDTKQLAAADVDTRIYFHATRVYPADRPAEIDLDYWWYLPDNPAHSGSGAFCGPGFEIGGATCFDHQSDWEGVTVVLDPAKPDEAPAAVNYAQHDGSVRYTWPALQSLWRRTHADRLASAGDQGMRPLVFPARGTHASYPVPCGRPSCPRNPVPGHEGSGALQDKPHNGAIPWLPNDDGRCAGACVAALPTHHNGTEAQGWNAWDGEWGTANCIMGILCSSAKPPVSPGQQSRYEHPWCTKDAYGVDAAGNVVPMAVPRCVKEPVGGGDLARGGTLLALGDSYSSGEGAGHYEPGTDTSANTCHRSSSAWPTLLADLRHMSAIPSLACSGAVLMDVLVGRPTGEAERRRGQIPRITGKPDVITITIGGNDLGFRKVLEDCIARDCVRHYHRPSGDQLDSAIDKLARNLPAAYRRIQAAASAARVVVVDYPKLFPDSDPAHPTPNCAAGDLITPAEGNYLNDKVQRADVAILDSAHQAGVTAIDVSTALQDSELTCSGTQYFNHANPQLTVLSGSFHPNAAGQHRLANAVNSALSDLDH